MVQYWRAAGMTYLKYSTTCAELVRQALKEPIRSQVLNRAGYAMIKGEWESGKIVQRTLIEPTGSSSAPAVAK
ncbi:ATP synthase subunit epsilon, mitochondrial [Gracilariopsis chorda]|uniref:ATP synthase subunit epsilon, mitochondrial n=1 Tax=Gracilariopsis chorda TaxID=448386 RepID=A0A2V3IPB8_9FLOR|nr:ATP synthase subunit epsilon, mitochondrial [Gracilariopsis chorda]|eukprot:PXF43897.1 ATP synthase subunit epsilon, mitochondrial [Gracilariopsis chorda]